MTAVVLEVLESPVPEGGCSAMDRRTFRRRTIPRLLEEFGDRLQVVWEEPPRSTHTLPTTVIAGKPIHSGGYLPWEIIRPIVAYALAVEGELEEFRDSAARQLADLGIDAEDWQTGLLEWLERRRDDDPEPGRNR